MTGNRRIPRNQARSGFAGDQSSILTYHDLNARYLTLDRQGRVTINLERLAQDLNIQTAVDTFTGPKSTGIVPDPKIANNKFLRDDGTWQREATFSGAGDDGLVPDPVTESGNFLQDDGTWAAPSGAGDMLKSVYDTDADNIVDKAESVDDGAGNVKTAAEIKTHIDSTSNPHATALNDVSLTGVGLKDTGGMDLRGISGESADGVSVSLDAVNNVAEVGLTNKAVPYTKLDTTNADAVLVTDNVVTPNVGEVAVGDYGMIARKSTGRLESIAPGGNNFWVGRGTTSTNTTGFKKMNRLVESLCDDGSIAGTSFPSTVGAPQDGWPFYRTDHGMLYVYDSTYSGWFSVTEYLVVSALTGTHSAAANMEPQVTGQAFANTYGYVFPFDTKCVWMSCAGTAFSGTSVTFVMRDFTVGGTPANLTNSSLVMTSRTGSANFLAGPVTGTLTAGNPVGGRLHTTAGSGSIDNPVLLASFRRFET